MVASAVVFVAQITSHAMPADGPTRFDRDCVRKLTFIESAVINFALKAICMDCGGGEEGKLGGLAQAVCRVLTIIQSFIGSINIQ